MNLKPKTMGVQLPASGPVEEADGLAQSRRFWRGWARSHNAVVARFQASSKFDQRERRWWLFLYCQAATLPKAHRGRRWEIQAALDRSPALDAPSEVVLTGVP